MNFDGRTAVAFSVWRAEDLLTLGGELKGRMQTISLERAMVMNFIGFVKRNATSAANDLSQSLRKAPVVGSTSKADPILITMRFAALRDAIPNLPVPLLFLACAQRQFHGARRATPPQLPRG